MRKMSAQSLFSKTKGCCFIFFGGPGRRGPPNQYGRFSLIVRCSSSLRIYFGSRPKSLSGNVFLSGALCFLSDGILKGRGGLRDISSHVLEGPCTVSSTLSK